MTLSCARDCVHLPPVMGSTLPAMQLRDPAPVPSPVCALLYHSHQQLSQMGFLDCETQISMQEVYWDMLCGSIPVGGEGRKASRIGRMEK